ncbi:hypothetical protein [Clostridium sp. JN-1]|nr:hypothetical protein [Clostridium sp. JN-1]
MDKRFNVIDEGFDSIDKKLDGIVDLSLEFNAVVSMFMIQH